jgi:hypothetical protein
VEGGGGSDGKQLELLMIYGRSVTVSCSYCSVLSATALHAC